MKHKISFRSLLGILVVLFAGTVQAAPRAITHADIKWSINSIGQLTAYIDLVGLIDRPDSDGVYRNGPNKGEIQYRLPESQWKVAGGAGSGPVISANGWSPDSRTVYATHVTYASMDLRVCTQNEGCSVPYVVNLAPKIHMFGGVSPGIVSKVQPVLKVYMKNVAAGGVSFLIAQNNFNPFGTREFLKTREATVVGSCQGLKDTFCDIQVPAEFLETPAKYMLSVTSSLGGQENMKQFEVVHPAKPLLVVPDGIRSQLLSILKLQIPPSSGNSQTSIKVKSPLCLTPVDGVILDRTDTELIVKIPPPCLPDLGSGEIELEVKNRSVKTDFTIPYDIKEPST